MACMRRVQCLYYLTLISLLCPAASLAPAIPSMSLPGCPDKCGDVAIPYPFGTIPGCFRPGFKIKCDESSKPPKAFLDLDNLELLDINITSAEARVLSSIRYKCHNTSTSLANQSNPYWTDTAGTPYLFSHRRNRFTAIGCYTLAYIAGCSKSSYKSGCVSFCENLNSTTGDYGACNGLGCCQTSIPAGLDCYSVEWGLSKSKAWSFNPCSYAALVQEDHFSFTVDDLEGFRFYERNKNYVPVVLDWAIRKKGTCLASNVESSENQTCQSSNSVCINATNGEGYICQCMQGYQGNPYMTNGCTGNEIKYYQRLARTFFNWMQ